MHLVGTACFCCPPRVLLLLLSRFSSVRLCATPQTAAHQTPRLWDSPGKNTGVGCHLLLQCMKVKSRSEVAQQFPTLSDPIDCSLPGSSVHGTFQAIVLEWGAITFPQLLLFQALLSSRSPLPGSCSTSQHTEFGEKEVVCLSVSLLHSQGSRLLTQVLSHSPSGEITG